MTAGCNFDGGDCETRFTGAGPAALSACNRTQCGVLYQAPPPLLPRPFGLVFGHPLPCRPSRPAPHN
jgi:hypothetical protein